MDTTETLKTQAQLLELDITRNVANFIMEGNTKTYKEENKESPLKTTTSRNIRAQLVMENIIDKLQQADYESDKQESNFRQFRAGKRYGIGSFENSIYEAYYKADGSNRKKLVRAFPQYFNHNDIDF